MDSDIGSTQKIQIIKKKNFFRQIPIPYEILNNLSKLLDCKCRE